MKPASLADRHLSPRVMHARPREASESARKAMHDFYLGNTRQVNNWDLVDASAPTLVGAYLLGQSRKPIHRLAKSGDLWERRIAIVATQHFIRNDDFALHTKSRLHIYARGCTRTPPGAWLAGRMEAGFLSP
jgi:hypothetical protein